MTYAYPKKQYCLLTWRLQLAGINAYLETLTIKVA
jgi:hypothetical protein